MISRAPSLPLQIVLAVVLPVAIMAAALTAYFTQLRYGELAESLNRQGELTAEYLASAAEFGLFSGDKESLRTLMRAPLLNADINGVTFLNSELRPVVTGGEMRVPRGLQSQLTDREGEDFSSLRLGNQLFHYRAVRYTAEAISDFPEEGLDGVELTLGGAGKRGQSAVATPDLLGWVVVRMTEERLAATQRDMLIGSFLVAALGVLFGAIVSAIIGRGITGPLRRLSDVVNRIESGDDALRATVEGSRETELLARVVNRLADTSQTTREELEQSVEQATSQLRGAMRDVAARNKQLEVTKNDLEAAVKAKDQFLARMSHELRTPLTTVIGYTGLMSRTELAGTQQEYNRNIVQASKLLLATIDDILDYAKLEAQELKLESIAFNLEQNLDDLIAMHSYAANRKSLELVLLIEADVPQSYSGDAVRLNQVLNNILSNALKFTEAGEVVLRVEKLEEQGQKSLLQFSVRDTGIGIDASRLSELFQPFTQADTSIARRFGGSGLGLVIARQLTEIMGGNIEVSSEPGRGTDVVVRLPLQRNDATALNEDTVNLQSHILIYESHALTLRSLRTQFARYCSDVFAVSDTGKLLTHLEKTPEIDLLVLSLSAAETSALNTSELLATVRIHFSGVILLLSSHQDADNVLPRSVTELYGPLRYMSKPVRRQRLFEIASLSSLGGGVQSGATVRSLASAKKANHVDNSIGGLEGLHLLVAEDNSFNLRLIAELLTLAGATVDQASDGAMAVDACMATDYDLVLMDIHMPDMNGIEATRAICAANPEAVVLGLTADFVSSEEQALRDAGAQDILHKPIDEAKLIASIRRYSGRAVNPVPITAGKPDYKVVTTVAVTAKNGAALEADRRAELNAELSRLYDELCVLTNMKGEEGVRRGVNKGADVAYDKIGETLHEMAGLSGLFGLPEVQSSVRAMRNAVRSQDSDAISIEMSALGDSLAAL